MYFFAVASILFTTVAGVLANPVVERNNPQSIASVFYTLMDTVAPLAEQLSYATPENGTYANINPIISEMNEAVQTALTGLQGLQGQEYNVIMASLDGTTTLETADINGFIGTAFQKFFVSLSVVLARANPSLADTTALWSGVLKGSLDMLSAIVTLVPDVTATPSVFAASILEAVKILGITNVAARAFWALF